MRFLFEIRTRAVSCKQMTMVTPLQLLMFASRTVRSDGEFIQLDSWSVFIRLLSSLINSGRVESLSDEMIWSNEIINSSVLGHKSP